MTTSSTCGSVVIVLINVYEYHKDNSYMQDCRIHGFKYKNPAFMCPATEGKEYSHIELATNES